jgi:hypothetical protein
MFLVFEAEPMTKIEFLWAISLLGIAHFYGLKCFMNYLQVTVYFGGRVKPRRDFDVLRHRMFFFLFPLCCYVDVWWVR